MLIRIPEQVTIAAFIPLVPNVVLSLSHTSLQCSISSDDPNAKLPHFYQLLHSPSGRRGVRNSPFVRHCRPGVMSPGRPLRRPPALRAAAASGLAMSGNLAYKRRPGPGRDPVLPSQGSRQAIAVCMHGRPQVSLPCISRCECHSCFTKPQQQHTSLHQENSKLQAS